MMAAFAITCYRLQTANRWREIDSALQARLTALSKSVRDSLHDRPPGPPPPFEGKERYPRDRPHDGPPGGRRGEFRFGPPEHGRGPNHPPPPRQWASAAAQFAPSPEAASLFAAGSGYYYVIWLRDGAVVKRSDNAPSDTPPPDFADRDSLPHFRTRGSWREAIHCTGFGDCSLAGRRVESDLAAARSLAWTLAGAGAVVLALGYGLGWMLIGRSIRPVEEIGAAAARFAGGNLAERISVSDPASELGRLSSQLNQTFERLEAAFLRQRQFTADAAHELRTPLAILISEAQTTLARERSAAEYRETLESGLETAQQMRRITEMLLELARFDAAAEKRDVRKAENVAAAVRRAIENLHPMAYDRGVAVDARLDTACVSVARESLDVIIANLLTNAIEYNRPGGEVRVETDVEGDFAALRVSDTGTGISPDDLPYIFDRFYRADKSRSRARGHAGLGLAICKTIVEAERGSIAVESKLGEGTVFTVRLPMAADYNRSCPSRAGACLPLSR